MQKKLVKQQGDSQFQKINSTIHIIEQQTDQIFSVALSFLVMDPVTCKEIAETFSIIIIIINTFTGLYQNNISKYKKLNKINIKSLKRSKHKLQVVMDYHIEVENTFRKF